MASNKKSFLILQNKIQTKRISDKIKQKLKKKTKWLDIKKIHKEDVLICIRHGD